MTTELLDPFHRGNRRVGLGIQHKEGPREERGRVTLPEGLMQAVITCFHRRFASRKNDGKASGSGGHLWGQGMSQKYPKRQEVR